MSGVVAGCIVRIWIDRVLLRTMSTLAVPWYRATVRDLTGYMCGI